MVTFDDVGVRSIRMDGEVEEVTWEELRKAWIMTTDDGPWLEDVFFVLEGDGRGCVIAQEAMPDGLLERLQELPGFDNAAVIAAMTCTDNDRFVCWTRAA